MVSSGRIERYLPTFYSWGRKIKSFVLEDTHTATPHSRSWARLDQEVLFGGRLDSYHSIFASNTARTVFKPGVEQKGAAMVTGPNTDSYLTKQEKADETWGRLPKNAQVAIADAEQKFFFGSNTITRNVMKVSDEAIGPFMSTKTILNNGSLLSRLWSWLKG